MSSISSSVLFNPLKHQVQFSTNKSMTKSGFAHLSDPVVQEDADLPPKRNWKDTAVRRNKSQQMNKKREADNVKNISKPWPDLPGQLIKIISKQVHEYRDSNCSLLQSLSFDGIAKTWRSPSKQCNNSNQQFPLLELISSPKRQDTQNVYRIPELPWSNGWFCRKYMRMPPQDPVIGSSHGELIMKSLTKPCEYYLWRPPGSSMWLPQCDDDVPFERVILSSSPDHRNTTTILALTGGSKPAFMFCHTIGEDYRWIKEYCSIQDPNSSGNSQCTMHFTNAVFVRGKFYALSLQGTLAIIDTDSIDPPRVTILGTKRAIPSVISRCFKEYLIESGEEILLVFLISLKTMNFVDNIEVFHLDLMNTKSWVKMESLGDRTLFVGSNCCMTVSASELGCRKNCVYFKQSMVDDAWWVFDMEGGTITQGWNENSTEKSPTWVAPVPV